MLTIMYIQETQEDYKDMQLIHPWEWQKWDELLYDFSDYADTAVW